MPLFRKVIHAVAGICGRRTSVPAVEDASRWLQEFLKSRPVKRIKRGQKWKNKRLLPKTEEEWTNLLKEANDHWHRTKRTNDPELHQKLFAIMCCVYKGMYYLRNGMDTSRIIHEEPTDFLLHAIVGVGHDLCCLNFLEDSIQLFPDQLQIPEPLHQRLPLAVAAVSKGREMCLKLLLEAYPKAIQVPDAHGLYPLHLACARGSHWVQRDVPWTEQAVVALLFQSWPEALGIQAGIEGMTPLMLAAASPHGRAPVDTMYNLLLNDPTIVSNFR